MHRSPPNLRFRSRMWTVLKRKIVITVTGKLECTMTTHLRLKKRREKGESSRVDYSLQAH